MTVLVVLVLLTTALGQEVEKDPCEPNPCGENTRCQAVFIRGNPVISCDCLPDYKYPLGGDSSDGCVEVRKCTFRFLSIFNSLSVVVFVLMFYASPLDKYN